MRGGEFNQKRWTEQERMKKNSERNSQDLSIDNQQYFQKLQQNHQVEQNNQKIHDRYLETKNQRELNQLYTQNNINNQPFNLFTDTKQIKSQPTININNKERIPYHFIDNKKQLITESQSALISHKKNRSEFQPSKNLDNYNNNNNDNNLFINTPQNKRLQNNRSLPPIDNNFKNDFYNLINLQSNSTQNTKQYNYGKHSPIKQNFNTPQNRKNYGSDQQIYLPNETKTLFKPDNIQEQKIRYSESQINQIYKHNRNPKQIDDNTNNNNINQFQQGLGGNAIQFNQKLYHVSKKEDEEEFRKKLIHQNERLMQMFEQMQRNHKEEIDLIKYREKQTMKLIRQQQEQIELQNKKISCRDMPPPSFFLAPLKF